MKVWRKVFHMMGVLILLYLLFNRREAITIMVVILIFNFILEYLRMNSKWFNKFISHPELIRKNEIQRMWGVTWYLSGILISIILFEKHIAILSVLFLAIADPWAEIFGKGFGKLHILKGKTMEGALGFFLCALIVAVIFAKIFQIPFVVVFAGAIAATLAELFSYKWDDNLTIPIISGLIMSLII